MQISFIQKHSTLHSSLHRVPGADLDSETSCSNSGYHLEKAEGWQKASNLTSLTSFNQPVSGVHPASPHSPGSKQGTSSFTSIWGTLRVLPFPEQVSPDFGAEREYPATLVCAFSPRFPVPSPSQPARGIHVASRGTRIVKAERERQVFCFSLPKLSSESPPQEEVLGAKLLICMKGSLIYGRPPKAPRKRREKGQDWPVPGTPVLAEGR